MKKLNPESVKEYIFFSVPFSKDMYSTSKDLNCKIYRYNYTGGKVEEYIKLLDEALIEAMHRIKDKYPDNTTFGLGLSGGLDSRLVLHYAMKAEMKLRCFIIGESRPHFLFLSKDHKNALRIAKLYNIEMPKFVGLDLKNWQELFKENCERSPFTWIAGFGPFAKRRDFPDFDVLLTGVGGGEMMGSSIFNPNINSFSKEELTNYIIKWYSLLDPYKYTNPKREHTHSIPGILTNDEYDVIWEKIYRFTEKFENNIECVQSFQLGMLKDNPFIEDNIWGYETETPFYHSNVFNVFMQLKPEWIICRRFQKEFFNKVVPRLSKIGDQKWHVPFYYQDKPFQLIRKLWYLGDFVLRWYALDYFKWFEKIKHSKFSKKVLLHPNEVFDALFNPYNVLNLPKKYNMLFMELLKLKYVMDHII